MILSNKKNHKSRLTTNINRKFLYKPFQLYQISHLNFKSNHITAAKTDLMDFYQIVWKAVRAISSL